MDDPLPTLETAEARVLGSLLEKQIATPDYYPLTLNALVNACNQLTNREPVVTFDETVVVQAIDGLRSKRLATLYSGAESRVAKYKHTLPDVLLLTPAESALLCVLLLRGPQTLGELRTRAERLFSFDSLAEVEETLAALAARQPQALVARLPRQPGTKEARYAHLLSLPPAAPVAAGAPVRTLEAPPPAPTDPAGPAGNERLAKLEDEMAELRRELVELKKEFADFRRQFD